MRRLRGAVSSASGAVMRHHVVLTAVAAARVPHAVLPVAALPLLHHLAALGCPRQPRSHPGQCVGRDGEQSRLMLEALEAPLADSRAAAVNIRLISCIGRQAKIGFCLQTRNSFNLLWCQVP